MERDDIVVLKIKQLLDGQNIRYKYLEHEPAITSKDAARIRISKPEEGAKALILKTSKSKKNFMVVLPGNLKIDSKKVKAVIKEDFKFEEPTIILDKFGIIVGGVPPFWHIVSEGEGINDVMPALIDNKLLDNEQVAFNCGKRTCSIIMDSRDYKNVVKGIWGDFSGH